MSFRRSVATRILVSTAVGAAVLAWRPFCRGDETDARAIEMRLRRHVEFLASDELEGRGPNTDGLDRAAEYLAGEFSRLGLRTAIFGDSPFQEFRLKRLRDSRPFKNVAALLPGADGHVDGEHVILGAHYDHLGMGGDGSLAPWTMAVHNGADDNASGVAVLLETARLLAKRETPPTRPVLFLAFSAEEQGLLGSEYYVRHPAISLEQTVAMLNLDMVGRLRDDRLTVYGVGSAAEFPSLLAPRAKQHALALRVSRGGLGPSDHASFYLRRVPVLHFFTGYHADYHRPGDDAEKLNYGGMRRIASFVTEVVVDLADAETRPVFTPGRAFAGIAPEAEDRETEPKASGRPSLGVAQRSGSTEKGFRVDRVVPDSAAERAGVRVGDLILEADEREIETTADLVAVIQAKQPGDRVRLLVRRGSLELRLDAFLGEQ